MNRFLLFILVCWGLPLLAQVPTTTELGPDRQSESRTGFYQIAKPFEISMKINIWGEIPSQGLYIVPVSTDIIQMLSFAGGPRESSNLEEVLLYRASTDPKDTKTRTVSAVNVQSIIEGKTPTLMLMPGDMLFVKKLPAGISWSDAALIVTTISSVVVLGLTIRNLSK